MAVRTITCIPGVTGDWRYPGGGVHYDTRGFFGMNWAALWRDDLRPRDTRILHMTRLGEGLLDLDNPPVKALFVYASNPAVSIPHQTKVLRGLARDDLFTVVVEHFLTDTTRYADIVLPATMAIEHRDLLIAYGHLYLAWNEPAVAPAGECLPTTEIFRRLARTMGLDEPALYDSDESMARQVLDSGHPSLEGITLEQLKARGSIRLNYPDPFVPFATGFPTPSGRLEFVSDRMAQVGLDPVAGYTPSYEAARARHDARARIPARAGHAGESLFLEFDFRQRSPAAATVGRPDAADPSRRCRAAAHCGGGRGARRQRARLVRGGRRGERSHPARRRRHHERTLAARLERGHDGQRHGRRARFGHGRRRGVSRQPRACGQDVIARVVRAFRPALLGGAKARQAGLKPRHYGWYDQALIKPYSRCSLQPARASQDPGVHGRCRRHGRIDGWRDDGDLQRRLRRAAATVAVSPRRAGVLDLVRSARPRSHAVQRS